MQHLLQVIRTEPPRTIIQNIQGRGRARLLNATYAVIVLDLAESDEADQCAGPVDE